MMWDELASIPPGLWGLLGTVLGAYAVHQGQKRLKSADDRRERGRDYRGEISELIGRLDRLEEEVTFWRKKFYEEQEANALLRILLIQHGVRPPRIVLPPDTIDE